MSILRGRGDADVSGKGKLLREIEVLQAENEALRADNDRLAVEAKPKTPLDAFREACISGDPNAIHDANLRLSGIELPTPAQQAQIDAFWRHHRANLAAAGVGLIC